MFAPRAVRGLSWAVGAQAHWAADDAKANLLLDRYREGWAETNVGKIFAAVSPDYCLSDPLVGQFSRWTILMYFERLRAKSGRGGVVSARDLAVNLTGPIDGPSQLGLLKFYREAPRLGLTGETLIAIGKHGVEAEVVAYDLSLASDALRRQA